MESAGKLAMREQARGALESMKISRKDAKLAKVRDTICDSSNADLGECRVLRALPSQSRR
jgi:hypothetical protein